MPVTIKDIAKKANVSITTVSRVLNNKAEGIGEATRKRVLEIIDELDYRPNTIARSMVTKQTNTIGLIIPDIRNPFFPELVRGVEDVANQSKYSLFLCNTDGSMEKEAEALKLMREKNVDGIVFTYSYAAMDQLFEELAQKYRIPVVLLDRGLEDETFSGVYTDNQKAGYIATKHLIELSHVRIGCITGPGYIQNSRDRLKGYKRALEEYQISIDERLIKSGEYKMEGGYQAAKALLEESDVTAIFALNDLMAFGVYQAAAELGIHIPNDLSVVGFDNLKYNQLLTPKLTTIDQSVYQMGKEAAQMLLSQIKERGEVEPRNIYLDPKLIVRESSAIPKNTSMS